MSSPKRHVFIALLFLLKCNKLWNPNSLFPGRKLDLFFSSLSRLATVNTAEMMVLNTPYFKMAAILVFFCLLAN